MEDQFHALVQEKILVALETPLPALTRRDATAPKLPGKAKAVAGMRRAGKTSFLHQCRLVAQFPCRGLEGFDFEVGIEVA